MRRFLTTQDQEGYFDFFSNLIVLARYDKEDAPAIRRSMLWKPGEGTNAREIAIRALLKHEATHFLDMTTTVWGAQYIYRKLQMVKAFEGGEPESQRTQRVFMIETTEVDMHEAMLQVGAEEPKHCETLHHTLRYSEQFGTVLIILYYLQGRCCHQVPLSMLSLLEANATASEFLSEIEYINSINEKVDFQLSQEDIQRRFNSLLNDPTRLEYSVLLRLAQMHFPQLTLQELLVLVAALCRFSLNATEMGMMVMADIIEWSAENPVLGRSIAMELRRGSQRQLLYFKTLLLMYGWMREMSATQNSEYTFLIKNDPISAIRSLWLDRFKVSPLAFDLGREWMPGRRQAQLKEFGVLADAKIYQESFFANSNKLENKSAGILSFEEMSLLDILLADDSAIAFPNRIDLDVLNYFDSNLAIFGKMNSIYRTQKPNRLHMPPDIIEFEVR